MGLHNKAKIDGQILYKGQDIANISPNKLNKLRGKEMGMIFQDPLSALNPLMIIGDQIDEILTLHQPKMSSKEKKDKVIDLLNQVGIPRPEQIYKQYPHELSGGMRQRVVIAIAIANKPELLIADEPTTALDVTIQLQILELIRDLKNEINAGIILITHDLGVVAEMADRVAVMYAGEIVEIADIYTLMNNAKHPYTRSLLNSIPTITEEKSKLHVIQGIVPSLKIFLAKGADSRPESRGSVIRPMKRTRRCMKLLQVTLYAAPVTSTFISLIKLRRNNIMALLEVEGLKIHFPIRGGLIKREIGSIKAVDDVSFSIEQGQTYGLVGESGSGKTTTGRAVIGLNHVTAGRILFNGKDLTKERRKDRQLQRDVQMIFQDPYSSLNPKKRVIDIIAEPLRNYERLTATEEKRQVRDLLEKVGLSPESIYKYPHEFSGGQRQRIGIARAIALKPKLIIADEPVSALDVSVQAQVLNFMQEIQKS